MSTQTITNFSHVNRLDIEEARQDLGMKLVGLWITEKVNRLSPYISRSSRMLRTIWTPWRRQSEH
jgi:hypothetical protein